MKKRIAAALCALVMVLGSGTVLYEYGALPMSADAASVSDPAGSLDISALNKGSAVALPSELIDYTNTESQCRQIYNEKNNGIYFLNGKELSFLSLDDGSYGSLCTFTLSSELVKEYVKANYTDRGAKLSDVSVSTVQMVDSYENGNKLYLLVKPRWTEKYLIGSPKSKTFNMGLYALLTYDLDSMALTNSQILPDSDTKVYMNVGADSENRFYFSYSKSVDESSGSSVSKYFMSLNNSSLDLLDEVSLPCEMRRFGAADPATGNFCYEGSGTWGSSSKTYDVCALYAGTVKANKLSAYSDYMALIGYDDPTRRAFLGRHISFEDGKYFCVDTPAQNNAKVFDTSTFPDANKSLLLNIEREYENDSSGSMLTGAIGSRTVAGFGSDDTLITVRGKNVIDEIGTSDGEVIASRDAAHSVFSLLRSGSDVIAVEKQSDSYYLQKFTWIKTTKLTLNSENVTIDAGSAFKLTAEGNGGYTEKFTWSTSDPTIASVNSDGIVYGTHAGTAYITAKNRDGVSAQCKVTVKDTVLSQASGTSIDLADTGASSENVSDNNYSVHGVIVNSYMTELSDGSLLRAEHIGNEVVIEKYSSDGSKLISSQKIADELPIFGGIFFGKDYNFIVYGQRNEKETDSFEVLRTVKYTKDWKRVSQATVNGADTYEPFDSGSLRMTEVDGKLYIYTCHLIYSDHHQSNMIFVINENDMTVEDSYYKITNIRDGGISHSFNQFIRTDGEKIYRVDHGDAHPRSVAILSSDIGASVKKVSYTTDPFIIAGNSGDNRTGVSIGGFELSSENCIIAGNTIDQDNFDSSKQRNIFISVTSKTLDGSEVKMLTDYPEDSGITVYTPQLVKLADDSFMVMWEESKDHDTPTVKVCTIDGSGTLTSDITELKDVRLSDCQPFVGSDGLVKWYVTKSGTPHLYEINPFIPEKMTAGDSGSGDITKRIPGDVNNDGLVDMVDLALLQQYLAKWEVEINESASDVTADGIVDLRDLALLQQYLADWEVELK